MTTPQPISFVGATADFRAGKASPRDLLEGLRHVPRVKPRAELSDAPRNLPLLEKATRTGDRYRVQLPESELYAPVDALKAAGARILSVAQIKPTLEEFFMNLVEADRAQANAIDVSGK